MRLSGQPFDSASSISGSSSALFADHARTRCRGRMLPRPGRYCAPSTSRPIQWLSNSARMSFKPVAGEVHLVERLHGREPGRAALVRLARILVVACGRAAGSSAPGQRVLERDHRQRGARGVAALSSPSILARASVRLRLVVDSENAVADRQAAPAPPDPSARAPTRSPRSRNGGSRRGSRSRAQPRRHRVRDGAVRHPWRSQWRSEFPDVPGTVTRS